MRGGARSHSGPAKDPNSARSDQLGFRLSALPAEGYLGKIPRFPLPPRIGVDEADTKRIKAREGFWWRWAWRTPQAWAWARPTESWRLPIIAMWVRTYVVCEGSNASSADKNSLHRFAEQIGLTDAGLKMMGWKVAEPVETLDEPKTDAGDAPDEPREAPTRRLRVVE